MADKLNRLAPIGNLDTDSDPRYVGRGEGRTGDTTQNRNTQIAGDAGSTSGDITPTLGTLFGFDLGTVSAQNKKYRLTFSGDATKSHQIRLLSTNRDANVANGSGTDGGIPFNGTQADFIAQWNASGTANMLATYPTATTAVIEMLSYDYYQFYVESTGTDDIEVVCTQEAIPVDLAGPLKDIGSYDLLGDLFVFSTTQDNEPTELDVTVTAVGPIVAGVYTGPLTFLTFNQPHGLVAGQWIRITNSEAPWLNGLFVVAQINTATQIGIPTVLAWGGTRPLFTIGSETVRIHPTGIGEIGVAQKDDNTDAWTYTRLLRSVELNFVSRKPVDCDAEKNQKRVSIYFEDDHNETRKFYYYGEYSLDGALSYINEENYYSLGIISRQMYGYQNKPSYKMSFVQQIQSGGDIPSGNIRYFYLLGDYFGNWTKPSDLSNIVITYSDVASGMALGDSPEKTSTNKINVLQISGIDTQLFKTARLGYYMSVGDAVSAFLLCEVPITQSDTEIKHSGSCESEAFDVGLLASNHIYGYDYAKSTRLIDNRLVRTNLRKKQMKDLVAFAKTFKHRIKEEFVISSTFASNEEEYQSTQNGFSRLGYMFNETYRFSFRGTIKATGEITPWFWVDDIKIDPFPNNTYNPSDNRRDQSGPDIVTDFDLTKNLGGPYPSNRWVKIPYVEFFDVDLNYQIDGESVFSLLDNIEFGRTEAPREVLCTGVAIFSVKFQGFQGADASYRLTPGGVNALDASDEARAACFPFDVFNITLTDHWMKYIITLPGADDLSETRFEYPFAYGPPFVGDNSISPGYPATATDNATPIYQYPTQNNLAFGTQVAYQDNPNRKNFQPWVSDRNMVSLYSPDIIMGKVSDLSGYDLVDFGEMLLPPNTTDEPFFNRTAANSGAMYSQYSKYFPENLGQSFFTYTVDEWKTLLPGEKDFIADGRSFKKGFGTAYRLFNTQSMVIVDDSHKNVGGPVLFIDNNGNGIAPQGKNIDYGLRYVQMYKPLTDKFCGKEGTVYYTTGASYKLSEITTASGVVGKGVLNVFGGDTMTQLTYLKGRYVDFGALDAAGFATWTDAQYSTEEVPGFGGGMKFYSQNRINSQLRYDDPEQIVFLGDGDNPIYPWLEEANGKDDGMTYAEKFTPTFPTGLLQPSFEEINKEPINHPQRIEFSNRKIYSSLEDAYLDRPPLNIKDLDLSFGEINHHENVSGELFTVQPRKYQLQYFNARGTLEASSSSVEVLIGDGSVLSRDGQTLSSYGTQHKWSCIKGLNDNGKDVLYWFNAENGLVMRFGEDGTRVISARGMAAFFANYTKWVKNKDEHAFEQGIRGVWDDRRKEAIWTFTGWRLIKQPWASGNLVESGEVVTNTNAPFDTYEEFPRFFRCTGVHQSSAATEPGVGPQWEHRWEVIPYTDKAYYSIFTICFNEMTNGFRCFYGHLPKTYLRWQNTFLSSHPVNRNLIFEHRLGEPTTWYGVDTFLTGTIAPKVEDAYFEMVVNEIPEQSFGGVAVDALTENAPDRVEYRTARQYTFDNAVDFEQRDDQFYSCIKNDATLTNNPDSDGEYLRGDFLKAKVFIFGGTYNLFHSIVVKIRETLRRTNT